MQHLGLGNSNLGPFWRTQSRVCGGHHAVLSSLLLPWDVLLVPTVRVQRHTVFHLTLPRESFQVQAPPPLFLSSSEWLSIGSVIRQSTLSFSCVSGTQSEPSEGDHHAVSSCFNCSVCCNGAEIFLLLAWCEIKAGRETLVGSGVWTLHHIS